MSIHDFIFSAHSNQRIRRHIVLWILCYIFLVISFPPLGGGSLNGIGEDGFVKYYKMVLIRCFFHLLCQMIFCYPFLYFLMPCFFWKKKYLQFICLILLLWTAVASFRYAVFSYAYNPIMQELKLHVDPSPVIFFRSFMQTITGPSFMGISFISIKLFKDWQQKQKNNFNLQKENSNAELKLLKAQIHPHFLFNTLNNIYSFTLNKSPQAKNILNKLEDMLHYMIEECDQPLVPLKKEIKLIRDYMDLEKVRYGDRLTLEVEIEGDYENKLVAPLLMIPFVENCFKHGASVMRGQQWIRLSIKINEDQLDFCLSNSKPPKVININSKKGIGLANVEKRLQLLYPGKYYLKKEATSDSFIVRLQIGLKQYPAADQEQNNSLIPKLQPA